MWNHSIGRYSKDSKPPALKKKISNVNHLLVKKSMTEPRHIASTLPPSIVCIRNKKMLLNVAISRYLEPINLRDNCTVGMQGNNF